MKVLKIEMIHDVVCSWCPIGYANLKQALHNLEVEADFHFLPYELNPDMGIHGEGVDEYLRRRYQWSELKLLNYREHLLSVAEQAGVSIDFANRTHYYNSYKAHRLIHWCEGYNRQKAFNELLIDAYFKQGLNISKTQVLLGLVEKLGLDRSQAEHALISDEIQQQLSLKMKRVQRLELSSVPAFIFEQSTLVTGSNSVEYFEQIIMSLANDEHNALTTQENSQ